MRNTTALAAKRVTSIICAAVMLTWLSGCNRPAATPPASTPQAAEGADSAAHDDELAHELGPHDGELVELGGGEFHAEVVHEHDAHSITVYLLDAFAKASAPVSSEELAVNVTVDGVPRQFKLPAMAEEGDPTGKSSRFQLVDEALCDALDAAGAEARVSVMIDGQSFSGSMRHAEHDHDGHDR